MPKSRITIQLVDDHELVRTGFRYLLENSSNIEVTVESETGRTAISDYHRFQPDIVLMDISMRDGLSGLDATRHILAKHPNAKIIVVSMMGREAAVRAMEAGAKGFLSKHSAAAELTDAIQSVVQGNAYIDHETAQQVALQHLNGQTENPLKKLSAREYEVFTHLANGSSIDNIAQRYCLSPKTVRSHKSRIMQKLELKNMIDFIRLAMKAGIIAQEPALPDAPTIDQADTTTDPLQNS